MRRALLAASSLFVVSGAQIVTAQQPTRPAGAAPQQQPQPGNGEIRGRVIETKSEAAIAKASIAVRTKQGTALVAGAIAGMDGSFKVQGLRPGVYSLRVTFIGFAPLLQDVTISAETPVANLGTIKLTPVAVAIEGVAVSEERATVTIEPDRNAYKAKDVAPAAGNASEVLDAVPSVSVDGDGKVSLRGNENVAVQINGRPSPIRGPQLGAYLKGLPANIVDRVEVIPNPSAKYDPEGMAGIINIVLKQTVDLGLSVGVNAAAAERDRYNGSTNVGYQAGAISSFTNFGVMKDQRSVVGINDRERYDALRALSSVTDQDIASVTGMNGQNFSSSVDYRLNPRDVLSNALAVNHRSMNDDGMSAYSEFNSSLIQTDRYDRPRDMNAWGWMADYNLAFKRTLEPRKHELSTEVRFNWTDDKDHTLLWRQAPADAATLARIEGEDDKTDAVGKTFNAQLDYMRAFKPRTKLESGLKSTTRWMDRDYAVLKDATGSGTWSESNLSNAFEFDETVHAVYGVLSQGAGKFDMQAGLRAEHASRDFHLGGSAQRYPYSYNSVFPSGVVMYNASDANQMKVSYSRRIRRPGTQELNPFPSFFDVQNVFIGNPNLSPEYTDAIELGYTHNMSKGTLQVSPFYRHTSNIIRVDINTADVIDGREVTSVSFKNLATSNSWGSDVTGSMRFGPKFNGFAAFNVFKMVTDGGSTSAVGSDAVTWSTRFNGNSQITPTLVLSGSYFYRAPMNIERGRFSAMQMTTFAIRKQLDGNKLAVTARYTDPFNTNVFKVRAGDDHVMQVTERNFGVRSLFLGVQYNYGQTPKVRQPKPDDQSQGQTGFPPPA